MTNHLMPAHTKTTESLSLGLWGCNGHQIHRQLAKYPRLRLIAFGGFDPESAMELQFHRLC
jgi:hypothetical protein